MLDPKLAFSLAVAVALTACTSEVPVGSRDGSADANARVDLGVPADTGVPVDAGTDAPVADTGTDVDAGPECVHDSDCHGAHVFCDHGYGCMMPGVCTPFDPTVLCTVVPDTVCGCDGHTYNTPCAAKAAGVSIDHGSRCPYFGAGCTSDLDCMDVEFCERDPGACGGTGTCTPRLIGAVCMVNCDPQCGCYGVTYMNECFRVHAGDSLQQPGACPGDPLPCTVESCCIHDSDCTLGQECLHNPDAPITTGKCKPIPASPDCWIDADCGGGHTCTDPYMCDCGTTCPRPDTPGTCT